MNRLGSTWRQLKAGDPGTRFQDLYAFRKKRRGPGWPPSRILWVGAGVLLLIGGLAIGWVPGPGGFIGFIGAGLLAMEWHPAAGLLDKAEVWARELWRKLRGRGVA